MAGNAGSLQGAAQKLDLKSQGGVMAVLKAIRHSSLPLSEQNELRDLIFLYTNGGGDQEIKQQLEERLAAVDLTPAPQTDTAGGQSGNEAVAETPAAAAEPQGVGQSRPTPQFSGPTSATAPAAPAPQQPSPAPAPQQQTTSAPAAAQPPAQPTPPPQPAPSQPEPAAYAGQPVPPPQSPQQPAPSPSPSQPPAAPPSAPQAAPSPTPPQPAPDAAPQPAPAASSGGPDHLARVREIKLAVNKLVGNPVNLVDINNEVGREYMTSLLEAMKKLNGGQPAEVEAAMQRLEQAFTSVKQAVESAPPGAVKSLSPKQAAAAEATETTKAPSQPASTPTSPPAAPEPAPAPTPSATPATSGPPTPPPQPAPEPAPAPNSAPQPEASVAPTPPPADFKQPGSLKSLADQARLSRSGEEAGGASWKAPKPPQPETPPASPAPAPTPSPTTASKPEPEASAAPKPAPEPPAAAEAPKQSSGLAARIAALTGGEAPETAPQTPQTPPTPPNTPAAAATPAPIPTQTPAAPASAPEPPAAAESSKKEGAPTTRAMDPNDPLMASEITEGLDQLLSEWSLFKSSGLFGTGPNGREHPLFLKLKDLSITNILAGRYDGAKPEIKQSVTDYMNGWRYEQGVVYEPGETFEHYLRRVIKHILDSKNQ